MQVIDKKGKPTGVRYNDWRFGTFQERDDCKSEQYHAWLADMEQQIGDMYSKVAAYMVDGPKYPYYWSSGLASRVR